MMPRAFLLKNYYPRNDMEDLQAAAANLLDLASSAPAPHNNAKEKVVNEVLRYNDLLKWDYEYEKSYWFDTSALMVSTTSNHQQHGALHSSLHNDSLGAAASLSSSSSSTASCSPPRIGRSFSGSSCDSSPKEGSDLIIPRLTSRDYSTKSFMDTTIKPASDNEEEEDGGRHDNNVNSTDTKKDCDKTQTGPSLPLMPRLLEDEFNRPPPKLTPNVVNTTIASVKVEEKDNQL